MKNYVELHQDEFVNSSRRTRQNIKTFCSKLIDVSADFLKEKNQLNESGFGVVNESVIDD